MYRKGHRCLVVSAYSLGRTKEGPTTRRCQSAFFLPGLRCEEAILISYSRILLPHRRIFALSLTGPKARKHDAEVQRKSSHHVFWHRVFRFRIVLSYFRIVLSHFHIVVSYFGIELSYFRILTVLSHRQDFYLTSTFALSNELVETAKQRWPKWNTVQVCLCRQTTAAF